MKGLAQFMRKFHLVAGTLEKDDVEFVKRHSAKVLYFADPSSYA